MTQSEPAVDNADCCGSWEDTAGIVLVGRPAELYPRRPGRTLLDVPSQDEEEEDDAISRTSPPQVLNAEFQSTSKNGSRFRRRCEFQVQISCFRPVSAERAS